MVEFTGGNEKYISAREPIVFENKTESKYEVCAGIVFHKSGIYEVSVVGNRTIVSEVSKRETGEWKPYTYVASDDWYQDKETRYRCSKCSVEVINKSNFCPNCGADMRGDKHEAD